jgi:CubicO group peptidase (beta-lactamase class C family)
VTNAATVQPSTAGFSADRLARLGRFLAAETAAGRFPGAVVGIVRGGDVVLLEAFGHRDVERHLPMTTDTLFWVASMTKPVTTAGLLLLHEQARLVLEAEVGEYLPAFAGRRVWDPAARGSAPDGALPTREAARQPTMLDLLRHTAGVPEGYLGRTALHAAYVEAVGDGMTPYTAAEFADRLGGLPLLHDPGTRWHYGWGLDLAGIALEALTGERLGEYLRREVFEPLGMTDTGFGIPADGSERFAAPYVVDPVTGEREPLPDLSRARFDSGGAGLVGTAADYLRFVRMLLARGAVGGGRLLARTTVDWMLADGLDPDVDVSRLQRPGWNPGHGFGLGVAVRRRTGATGPGSPGEVTWPGAAGTFWWADPREDLGVVVMAHVPRRLHARLQAQVRALVHQALL